MNQMQIQTFPPRLWFHHPIHRRPFPIQKTFRLQLHLRCKLSGLEGEWEPSDALEEEETLELTREESILAEQDFIADVDEASTDKAIEETAELFEHSFVVRGRNGEDIVVGAGMENQHYEDRKAFENPDELEKTKQFSVAMAIVADEMKCQNIRVLDIHTKRDWTDYFVIVTALSRTQLRAVLGKMEKVAKEEWRVKVQETAAPRSEWECIDFGDVVVHAFSPRTRDYYQLDEMYEDCYEVPIEFGPQIKSPEWTASYKSS